MSKIFGVGLSRTGTFSLNVALQIIGLRSVHFPKNIQEIEHHDAATDTTVSAGYAFLDMMYPGSKFILTVREPNEWFDSMNKAFSEVWHDEQSHAGKVGHWLFHGVPAKSENRDRLISIFNEHNSRVSAYFSSQTNRFLVMNISAGHGWDRLCPFLGVKAPSVPFPKIKHL